VLVAAVPFVVRPNSGRQTATTDRLIANALAPTEVNDWKVSATCNGVRARQFADAEFEFFSGPQP
jgi:hypothetical protein